MALPGKIILALIAALPAVLDCWQRRQAARGQAETEARVAAIRSDPAAAWLRKFGGQQPDGNIDNAAHKTGPDQPGNRQ